MAKLQGSSFFQPSIDWTQDPQNHVLRLYLPGFQKDDFSVKTNCSGNLTVTGKRSLGDGNYIRLDQVFEVPKDSHLDKIRGEFDGACLSLFVPKKVTEEEPLCAVSSEDERGGGGGGGEKGLMNELLETIRKNKRVIAAAVAAFSVGYLLAQKQGPSL